MTEEKKLEKNKVIAMVCALHEEVIHTINKDAISEENALECLNIYYFVTINSLAIQSVCEENGEVDMEKAMDKTKRIMQILDEK